MSQELLQLGALAVIFAFAVKEFFAFLKTSKENGSRDGATTLKDVLGELQLMNNNHLHSLEKAINDGNDRLVDTINNNSIKQIELLGEIKGKLEK